MLRVLMGPSHIWLTGERKGREVVVSVRDNGIGIPADSIASLFDMFNQVDRSIERSTGGLGILACPWSKAS